MPDRKDGIAPLISDYTAFNGAQPSASSGNIVFSWTDGNHPAVVSEANEDVETFNAAGGFQITVSADTAAKTLNLYAEVFFGQAVLQATLSDGSATAISDQSVIDSDVGSKVYSIDFRAASPGQTLTVTLASAATSSGGVGLQAATLTPHLPVVGIASPSGGQSFTTSSVVSVSVNASQFDSSINDVKAVNSDNTVLESPASPLNANLGPLAGGHYSITGSATDTTALIGTSAPVEFDVIGQGGTLSIQENVPSSPVNLDAQGNADWVLWGPENTGDSLFDLPGFILARKANVAPLISEYRPIGNHFITSQAFAHTLCFAGDLQNYCSGSEITVHGKGNGFEITVAADTTPRILQLYVGTLSADGVVTAFLSDGSAPVATEVGGTGPPQTNTTLYTINYSAASSGQTLTVRFTLNTDQGDGQVTLIGAAVNGSSSGPLGTAPQVTGISPNPGAANTKVTIAGSNFGSSQGQGSVYFGEVTAQIVNWSDTSIDVIVPAFLQPGNTVQVGIVTANGSSNLVSFSTPIYNIYPQNIAMLVGQSRTVSVTDANGNRVTGLGWSTDDLAIVSLSTDDPPVITALAPGQATVWAGDVSFPITVYAADSVPPGTPLWSLPVSSGSTVTDLVPAVPSDSGADVFSLDDGGTLTAVASDGTPVWKVSGIPSPSTAKIIPDFTGNTLLKTSYNFFDAQDNFHSTHKIQQVSQGTGQLTDLYTYTDQQSFRNLFDDSSSVQAAIPHPGGMLFLEDNTLIKTIDPTGILPPASATLDNSTFNEQPEKPFIGQMIVAGDGNAYVPYAYWNTTETFSGPSTSSTHKVTHVMLLRASPDGSSAKTELRSWIYDETCVPWTPPGHTTADGMQCSSSGPTPSVNNMSVITNAGGGAAVFTTTVLIGCSSSFFDGTRITSESGCGDTLAHVELDYVSQDAVSSQTPDAVVLPQGAFIPALQREDGSYIGTDADSIILGSSNLLAVGASGGILWQTPVTPTPTFITPLYATADGGVIVTSKQVQNCQTNPDRCDTVGTPMLYTLDQDGNVTQQMDDTGAKQSWNGQAYALSAGGLSQIQQPIGVAQESFQAISGGNASLNGVATVGCPCVFQTSDDSAFPSSGSGSSAPSAQAVVLGQFAPANIALSSAAALSTTVANCPICDLPAPIQAPTFSPSCVTFTGSGPTYLILIGDPGLFPHFEDQRFNIAAQTEANAWQSKGNTVVACRVSSVQNIVNALTSSGFLDGGIIYFGHSGAFGVRDSAGRVIIQISALGPGQGQGSDTNVDFNNVAQLSAVLTAFHGKDNIIGSNAHFLLNGCMAARIIPDTEFTASMRLRGGPPNAVYSTSIAQQIANQTRRGVYGYQVGTYFSLKDSATATSFDFRGEPRPVPQVLPLYLIPEGAHPKPLPTPVRPQQ